MKTDCAITRRIQTAKSPCPKSLNSLTLSAQRVTKTRRVALYRRQCACAQLCSFSLSLTFRGDKIIYLPARRYIPCPNFDVSTLDAVHRADLRFLSNDKLPRGRKVYRYALTVLDVASRQPLQKSGAPDPCKPLLLCCFEFCPRRTMSDGDVIAVGTHLNQLEVAAM